MKKEKLKQSFLSWLCLSIFIQSVFFGCGYGTEKQSKPTHILTIYDDARRIGFEDWSWNCNRNYRSTTFVHSGKYSIKVDLGTWGGLAFGRHSKISLKRYKYLQFWIHGGEIGHQRLRISFNTRIGNGEVPSGGKSINDLAYIEGGVVNARQWKLVNVPLAEWGVENLSIVKINIIDNSGSSLPTFYIDEVVLTGAAPETTARSQNIEPSNNELLESFEEDISQWKIPETTDTYWRDEYSTKKSRSRINASTGKYSLRLDFNTTKPKGNYYKATIYTDSKQPRDMTSYSSLIMDVFNPNEDTINVTISLSTGRDWKWHEARHIPLKRGWNKDIGFDLDATTFEVEIKGKKKERTIANKDNVQRLAIVFILPESGILGSVYLDNIHLRRK